MDDDGAKRQSREEIRRQLANDTESPREQKNGTEASGGRNLLVCFMNEALLVDEDSGKNDSLEKLTAIYIAKNNISRKKNHVIIPLNPPDPQVKDSTRDKVKKTNKTSHESAKSISDAEVDADAVLAVYLRQIRSEARQNLVAAKSLAKEQMRREKETDTAGTKSLAEQLEERFGLRIHRKLCRRELTSMNVDQLRVILNFLLTWVDELNGGLVERLMERDELIRKQDALLTDVEDITDGINGALATSQA